MSKNKKILIAVIIAIVIIIGIIIIAVKGLAFGLEFKNAQKIEFNLGQKFENSEMQKIAKETLGQNVIVEKIEIYEDAVSIKAEQITEEQKTNFITKINERYSSEIKPESVLVQDVSNIRGRDIIKPYIIPFIITTLIILAYLMIRYYKLNSIKILLQSLIIIILPQILLLSLIAITRIPINMITIAFIPFIYVISLIAIAIVFETKLNKNKEENN